jgi:catechol 2,3-dioxygenase-like lactoylglutathione lyase family enzyme
MSLRVGLVHHVALRVADPLRSLAFYEGLLGLRELRRFEEGEAVRSIWLQAGDTVVMLEQQLRGGGPEGGSGHLLAFAVTDLPAWEHRLAAAGAAVEDRTAHTLYLRDPDGHRVGLSSFPFPGTGPPTAA